MGRRFRRALMLTSSLVGVAALMAGATHPASAQVVVSDTDEAVLEVIEHVPGGPAFATSGGTPVSAGADATGAATPDNALAIDVSAFGRAAILLDAAGDIATVDGVSAAPEAEADAAGLFIDADQIAWIWNAGDLSVAASAEATLVGRAVTEPDGGGAQVGDYRARPAASAGAVGIEIAGSVEGDIANAGDLAIGAVARAAASGSALAGSGSYLGLAALAYAGTALAVAEAAGISGDLPVVAGGFTNTGALSIAASASAQANALAQAVLGPAFAFASGTGLATAKAFGIDLTAGMFGGGFDNSGAIDVSALAVHALHVQASGGTHAAAGAAHGAHATAMAVGIALDAPSVDAIENIGEIGASAIGRALILLEASGATASIAGAFLAPSANVEAIGVAIDVQTAGSIDNSGDIAAAASASAELRGRAVSAPRGGGAYVGDYNARPAAAAGAVALELEAQVDGDVANAGDLDVTAVARAAAIGSATAGAVALAYGAAADARAAATGISGAFPSVDGDIVNSGGVSAAAVASAEAEALVRVLGGPAFAFASGTGFATAEAFGIDLTVGMLGGGFENDGAIAVSALAVDELLAQATGGVRASGGGAGEGHATAIAVGIAMSASSMAGAFVNSGAISVVAEAQGRVDVRAVATTAAGTARAQVYWVPASAVAAGIEVAAGALAGFENSGAIAVGAVAQAEVDALASGVQAMARAKYAFATGATAVGIDLAVGTIAGDVANSGGVSVAATASALARAVAHNPSGGGAGAFAADFAVASARATGISVVADLLDGAVTNSGDVVVAARAVAQSIASAEGGKAQAQAGYARADATATGLSIAIGDLDGGVVNSAVIAVMASATALVSAIALGSVSAVATAAGGPAAMALAYGVHLSGGVTGGFTNSGVIVASAAAVADGTDSQGEGARAVAVAIADAATVDAIVNDGTIAASAAADMATAVALLVDGTVTGSIENRGTIVATATGTTATATALDASGADAALRFEQRDGLVIGDLQLTNGFGDTVEWSGGAIFGDMIGDGGDALVVVAGEDRSFDYAGDITGFALIAVGGSKPGGPPVTLRLSGTVADTGALSVAKSGTLVIGETAHVMVDSYSQTAGGTTIFELGPDGGSGLIAAASADLGGMIQAVFPSGLSVTGPVDYLVIDGGVAAGDQFTKVRSLSPLIKVTADYASSPGDVVLTAQRRAFDAVGGLTPAGGAVAAAIEADYGALAPAANGSAAMLTTAAAGVGDDFADVVATLFLLSAEEYREALDDLAGAEHAQMLRVGAGAIRSINTALLGRLAIVRGLTAEQMASVDQVGLEFTQVAATGDVDFQMDLAQAEAQAVAAPGDTGVWARVFGVDSSVDGDEEAPGFDAQGGGVSVGIDHRLSPDLVIGAYGGYAHTDADFDSAELIGGADGAVDTYLVGAYAGWASGALHVDGLVAGAWQSYELDRTIDFLGRNASSDYDGWGLAASAEVGYDVALGSTAILEPVVGLDYVHLETDGFTEDGADSVSLAVEDGSYDSLRSTLGVRLTAAIDAGGGVSLVPTAMLSWEHELLDADGAFTARFDGSPGATFDIIGSDDEADAAVLNLGLAVVSDTMTAFVAYDGRFTGDATSHQGTIGIRFGF